ncbi:FimV/HubP family polar landmark protein [Wenzhouxiangella sp. XN24]|uniref:FimV/HubP family polar landmark protein n=1 Tax=Wenzhouxiangella sp. XN24 TaxID=2713569 RepID=UPI0013EBC38B|nr:FimV/HubP family polar landmark protein [Wenzhouxiangella sp. XN24]NGX16951.1 hypothetical protein [Wenzhouxiangella sp. XN24]
MSRKLILLGVLSLVLAPGVALSVGLGDIRLNSYLNQRMDAEIPLRLSSRQDLESLEVQLASRETFSRYGLDRPGFFDELEFRVRGNDPANAVIDVTSAQPIIEPFLTFLVEVNWNGGRILREYTVLLDPPTFLPAREPAAVETPAAPAPATETQRPAPEARPVPAPRPIASPAPGAATEFGPVQRNDTLWEIARRVRPDSALTTNQVMVALYRANPNAFGGNINRLRAGAILRVPSRAQIASVSTGEANAEVRTQNQAWQGSAAAAPARRLELAPPTEAPDRAAPPATTAPGATEPAAASAAAAPSPQLLEAVEQLRGELAETRRLMELKDAEIAALQSRLAEIESEGVPVQPLPTAPVERPDAVEPDATEAPGEAVVEAEPAPEPAVEPTPEPAPVVVAPVVTPPVAAPSLMDRALLLLGSLWLWLVLAIVLIVAAVVLFLRRRNESESSIEEDLAETGKWAALDAAAGKAAPEATAGIAAAAAGAASTPPPPPRPRDTLESILVEESKPAAPPPEPEPLPAPAPEPETAGDEDYQYPFEDTIAGETGINLDQSDPMAEADFHMAYGLYDQAAEIVKKAIEREPDRYDLRRKLIDICFVWGNADEFLAQARAVREMGGADQAADWAKIAIMGRQIAPGEAMFAAGEAPSVDVDLGGDTAAPQDTSESGEWLDFDVGESDEPVATLGDTREHPGPGARRPIEETAELNLEDLGIDLDLGESGEHALEDLAAQVPDEAGDENEDQFTGTMRLEDTPAFDTSADESDEPDTRLAPGPSFPAEDEDDDGGTLMMEALDMPPSDDPTQRGEALGLSEDDPTLSGLSGISRDALGEDDTLLREARLSGEGDESPGEDDPTLTGFESLAADVGEDEQDDDEDRTMLARFEAADDSPTTEMGTIDEDVDLDLDELTQVLESDLESYKSEEDADATQMAPRYPGESDGDADATMMAPALEERGEQDEDDDATQMSPRPDAEEAGASYEAGDTREMSPVEMNEVGTKLDLARAYIDMGDPEGARSILGEVLEEGDEAQREEARELLDNLD